MAFTATHNAASRKPPQYRRAEERGAPKAGDALQSGSVRTRPSKFEQLGCEQDDREKRAEDFHAKRAQRLEMNPRGELVWRNQRLAERDLVSNAMGR